MTNTFFLTASLIFFTGLAVSSYREKEIRAFWICLILSAFSILVWGLILPAAGPAAGGMAAVIISGAILVSLIPFFPQKPLARDLSCAEQCDERDTMFARNMLGGHPDLMETYYNSRPQHESTDRRIHNKPGFGSPEQKYHHALTAPVYLAAFEYLEKTIPLSTGAPAPEKQSVDPALAARTIRETVRFYGGCDTGITPMAPHHYYSHKGRHARDWGSPTDQSYPTAITIVVPMRPAMLKQAPTSAVIQESAQKYVEAAKIANILAGYIRNLGYRARAHTDANYEVLCVPLAVDSGLGELGRMGIFMHRVHGPCVRLAVVTTDMALPPTRTSRHLHMAAFCRICKKCADNCPSGSIARGDEPASRGFTHWSIDQEKCFSYWKSIGSDCGMCIGVCPYTKPDTFFHRLVRWYISRNPVNQRIALFMDDLLYGRKKQIPAGKFFKSEWFEK